MLFFSSFSDRKEFSLIKKKKKGEGANNKAKIFV